MTKPVAGTIFIWHGCPFHTAQQDFDSGREVFESSAGFVMHDWRRKLWIATVGPAASVVAADASVALDEAATLAILLLRRQADELEELLTVP